jgi:hypothetical protein
MTGRGDNATACRLSGTQPGVRTRYVLLRSAGKARTAFPLCMRDHVRGVEYLFGATEREPGS